MSSSRPVSVPGICSRVNIPWSQTLVGNLDDSYDIKHALLDGSLPFHNHPDNDEAFYLLSGILRIEISSEGQKDDDENRNFKDMEMRVGDLFVVPKGVFHRPIGAKAHVLIMEKKGIPGGNGSIAKAV